MAKKTTELVLLFHKKTSKLVFLWPNMGQKHESVKRRYCIKQEDDDDADIVRNMCYGTLT